MITDEQIKEAVELRQRVADAVVLLPDGPTAPEFHNEFCATVDALTAALLQAEAMEKTRNVLRGIRENIGCG